MKRTLLVLAGLALSTTACGRIADQAKLMLSIEDDQTTLEVDEGAVKIDSETAPTSRVASDSNPAAVAPGVRVDKDGSEVRVDRDDSEVRVNKDGTKVRTGGGNVDVSKTNGDSVKVRKDGDGTRVEVGGVKVDGDKVTVPGVGTVYGY
jgi:ferric-dicitrate binding protein FerR (iron transport regulator)